MEYIILVGPFFVDCPIIKPEGKMGLLIGVILGGGLGLVFTNGGLVGLVIGAVVGGFVAWLYSGPNYPHHD